MQVVVVCLGYNRYLCLKMKSIEQLCQDAKHLGLQVQEKESTSTQLSAQSHLEEAAIGPSNLHSTSSKSGHDEGNEKSEEGQLKALMFMGNQEIILNFSQAEQNHSLGHIPYPYVVPQFGGMLTPYGSHPLIQPQMLGVGPAQVPLPLDLGEDGPIYVNPKQYRGILRRRESRAKLEAQNKLIKNRKPYLHESRHRHALNRVRGSGGRFLSKKMLCQSDQSSNSVPHRASNSPPVHQNGGISECEVHKIERANGGSACSDTMISSSNKDILWQADRRFFSMSSSHMGDGSMRGSSMCGGSQHCAPVVR